MDLWFSKHPKLEREYQQLVVRENNSLSNTDYFICDIEYANENGRFDMLAVKWESTSEARKKVDNLRFAIIEMKYGDGAMTGTSGIMPHINSVAEHLKNGALKNLKTEMAEVFNIKSRLGIIGNTKQIKGLNDEKAELIFLIANHDPSSTILLSELKEIKEQKDFEIKFAFANFMGYGLYIQNIKSLEETKKFLENYNN